MGFRSCSGGTPLSRHPAESHPQVLIIAHYSRPLKKFLNDFSDDFRDVKELPQDAERLFRKAAKIIDDTVGRDGFRRAGGAQLNTAQAEALMVGVMKNLAEGNLTDDIVGAVQGLRKSDVFTRATTRATADNDAVRDRLRETIAAFGSS